ncbi:MAG: mechanosensitive ion channel [Methylophilales bacterium]|nr:mechanosensitive ion channel [Methylophilales bacterium]
MSEFWQEIISDLSTTVIWPQLAVLGVSLGLAWFVNKLLIKSVHTHTSDSWQIGMGAVARVIFPLSALVFVSLGRILLQHVSRHSSLLQLAITLLLAMAVIRLAAYALRYVFTAAQWVRATENFVVFVVWGLVALHLTGQLEDFTTFLDELSFHVGNHKFSVLLLIQSVFIAVLTLIVTLWIGRVLENKLMRTQQLDINLRVVLSKFLRVLLILVGVLTALSVVGFDITLLSVFGGALGVGLGFGLQKIASNYVSGFIILLDHSLHPGDVLTVDGHYGVVGQLRARYLVLRKLDGTEVIIPNDALITSTVINHSLSDRRASVSVSVRVSYDSTLENAMKIMRESAVGVARVLSAPTPDVTVKQLADNGAELQLTVWVNDPELGVTGLQSELFIKILEGFRTNNVRIAVGVIPTK